LTAACRIDPFDANDTQAIIARQVDALLFSRRIAASHLSATRQSYNRDRRQKGIFHEVSSMVERRL
jgi:hypothetical protein